MTGSALIGLLNPIRYRGYYYDIETGLYYVSSRYYDPEIGRWINADNQIAGVGGEVLGYNMFAYCGNNPIIRMDPSGNFFFSATICGVAAWKVGAAIVALAGALLLTETIVNNPPKLPAINLPKTKIELKENKKEKEKEDVTSVPKPSRRDPIHHIVAQTDHRAKPAQEVLKAAGIDRFNDPANLVQLPARYHYTIHSDAYYEYVNKVIVSAYEAEGTEGVYSALAVLKWEISSGAIW